MKKLAILTLILASFFSFLFIGMKHAFRVHTATSLEEKPFEAAIITATPVREPVTLSLSGTLFAWQSSPILANVLGYLHKLNAEVGDFAEANTPIAFIEAPEINKQIMQAKAELLNATAKLELQANRVKYSSPELQDAVKAAKIKLAQLEKKSLQKQVIAPFSGVITSRTIDQDAQITSEEQELFVISNIETMKLFAEIPQNLQVIEGMNVDLTIQELPQKSFIGTIVAFEDSENKTKIEIHLKNKDKLLWPGYSAQATLKLLPYLATYFIPASCIISESQVALLDEEQCIQLVPVEIGRNWGATVEIKRGITSNDRIIANPNNQLKSGEYAITKT